MANEGDPAIWDNFYPYEHSSKIKVKFVNLTDRAKFSPCKQDLKLIFRG